ncbi:hypothetical protein EBL87_09135 [Cereibacter sphaeroides]|uniref:hypothetical protein n=1 Tax=Cereibacter sphaeroides TaxID=1063 RepID=UPI000F54038B|nr:hypothetical protein [Cereibacter sphaeroides]AZB63892.1 hypothetical protein EBL87_09135 [Cereibacter sphaeroides]AZB68186.1 hypothetical protein EBL86_07335 [Cereibacter sphaeroides]
MIIDLPPARARRAAELLATSRDPRDVAARNECLVIAFGARGAVPLGTSGSAPLPPRAARAFPPLSSAECNSVGLAPPRALRAPVYAPQSHSVGLSTILGMSVAFMAATFLVVAAWQHVAARTAATVAQAHERSSW